MENLIKANIDPSVFKITEAVWPQVSGLATGESFFYNIDDYDIKRRGIKINQLKIVKIKEGPAHIGILAEERENGITYIKLECKGLGGLAHEISHLVYKRINFDTIPLSSHILSQCRRANVELSIIDYFQIEKITEFDKLVGYLYLADDDELTAKLVGFYAKVKINNGATYGQSDYSKGVKELYAKMKTFKIDALETEKTDLKKGIISGYLKEREPVTSIKIETLLKHINAQGENFEEKYKILFNS
jgi:hypothetical protein